MAVEVSLNCDKSSGTDTRDETPGRRADDVLVTVCGLWCRLRMVPYVRDAPRATVTSYSKSHYHVTKRAPRPPPAPERSRHRSASGAPARPVAGKRKPARRAIAALRAGPTVDWRNQSCRRTSRNNLVLPVCAVPKKRKRLSHAHSFLFVQKWSLQHRPLNGVGGVPRLHLLNARVIQLAIQLPRM